MAFLNNIADSGAAGRTKQLQTLKDLGQKYRSRPFAWIWVEGGTYGDLETALEVSSSSYPTVAAVNAKKKKVALLRGAFTESAISEFVNGVVRTRL